MWLVLFVATSAFSVSTTVAASRERHDGDTRAFESYAAQATIGWALWLGCALMLVVPLVMSSRCAQRRREERHSVIAEE